MANTFGSSILQAIVARTLPTLRENCIATRLVNRDQINTAPVGFGDTVTMIIPTAVAVTDVTPQASPITPPNYVPGKVQVALDQWKKTGFHLTDKERDILINGGQIGQANECMKALANVVNSFVFTKLYQGTYGITSPAAAPFAGTDLTDASAARKVLNDQLAPLGDRRMVLDTTAEANLAKNPFIAAQYARGDSQTNREGTISRVMGFDVFMDQLVPTHTSTALTAGALTVNGVNAAGAGATEGGRFGTVSLAKATNAAPLVKGDILTINGATYVVTADTTLIVGNTTVPISPALRAATVGGEAVTLKATHVANLAFHRDAFAFASRPMTSEANPNTITVNDPQSGLAFRLELIRQHKQDYYEFDMLYGGELVRPEYAARIPG